MTEQTEVSSSTSDPYRPPSQPAQQRRFAVLLLAIFVIFAASPFVVNHYLITLLIEVLIFAILVTGLNFLLGHMGQVSLGHAAFLGTGAYATAICTMFFGWPVLLAMIASVAAAFVMALLVGLLSVRTKSVQFLLITLAFGQMFHAVAEKTRVTGGDDGMTGIPRIDLSAIGLPTGGDTGFLFVVLAAFAMTAVALRLLQVSTFGRIVGGIRENEKRMLALGYDTYRYKVITFAVSGLFAGLAGSLWVQHSYFVNPQVMTWQISGEALLMVIIGGSRSFFGPLIGAAFYVLAKAWLATITDSYLLFFGLLFVLVVAFLQGGVAGVISRLWSRRKSDPDGGVVAQ